MGHVVTRSWILNLFEAFPIEKRYWTETVKIDLQDLKRQLREVF